MENDTKTKDSVKNSWVEKAPLTIKPYLRLARYDRPTGFWLLALPGIIGLALAGIKNGLGFSDIKWALLIIIGAIAMRGAGCTYNDIIDKDLDAKVERTALRPLPAKTVTVKQAWVWLILQCLAGLLVLLFFPRPAQIIALLSLILVAIYPFLKRITYWPQAWLGLTFNWALLVAYITKTDFLDLPVFFLYFALVFWTIGYDTIYACQDKEDDALIGIKSTARLFGDKTKMAVAILYFISFVLSFIAIWQISLKSLFFIIPFGLHLLWQTLKISPESNANNPTLFLALFKSNLWAGLLLAGGLMLAGLLPIVS